MTTTSLRVVGRRAFMKSVSTTHVWLYRATGGRIGGRLVGMPVVLLTTTGRKSGKRRVAPLLYLEEGAAVVVVGSNGGYRRAPAWWLNLEADPNAVVQIGRERRPVVARKADAAEREQLWAAFVTAHAGYAAYAAKTDREIPVVVLDPR